MRELKNQLSGKMISMLILGGYIEEGGHHHLPMGHTHEDIGGVLRWYFVSSLLLLCAIKEHVVFLPRMKFD